MLSKLYRKSTSQTIFLSLPLKLKKKSLFYILPRPSNCTLYHQQNQMLEKKLSILDQNIQRLQEKISTSDKQNISKTEYIPFSNIDDYESIYRSITSSNKISLLGKRNNDEENEILSESITKPDIYRSITSSNKISLLGKRNNDEENEILSESITKPESSSSTLIITKRNNPEDIINQSSIDFDQIFNLKTTIKKKSLKEEDENYLLNQNKTIIKNNDAMFKNLYDPEIIKRLEKKSALSPDLIIYDHLLNHYSNIGNLDRAIEIFDQIEKNGFVPTLYSYANLIKAYAYHRRINDVFEVFNKLKMGNLIPNQEKNAEKAFDLYKEMLEQGLKLTGITYNSLIDAFQEMKEHGCSPDLITYNSLILSKSEITSENTMKKFKNNKILVIGKDEYPIFSTIPTSHLQTRLEAEMIFNYFLIENKSSFDSLLKIYKEIIPKHQVELSSWIFLHMLNACYKYNRFSLAWDVWNDFLGWSREESERIFKDFKNVYQQKMEFERIGLTEELELLLTRIKESDELGDETAKRYKREVITLWEGEDNLVLFVIYNKSTTGNVM
ncbi:6155_t:CDS:10 [Entrophospora sp. SA101]|nr:6155_t:CDS:10 [Entrophospora sp. SA101]